MVVLRSTSTTSCWVSAGPGQGRRSVAGNAQSAAEVVRSDGGRCHRRMCRFDLRRHSAAIGELQNSTAYRTFMPLMH